MHEAFVNRGGVVLVSRSCSPSGNKWAAWDTKPVAHQEDVPTPGNDTQNVFLCRRQVGQGGRSRRCADGPGHIFAGWCNPCSGSGGWIAVSNYRRLEDLPEDIQDYVRRLDQPDAEAWVRQPIPALDSQSVLDAINGSDGERRVREFLIRAIGHFG